MFGAGFREALPGAIITAALRQQPDAVPQDGYNAFEDPQVKGTPAEFQYHSQLMGMANPSQTASFLAAAASEERDRQILATSPGGTAVSVVTGLVLPSFFIPIFGEIGAAGKGLSVGVRVARGAAEFAAQSAISEAGLQSAQVTRPMSQSVENVATSAILGGIIGAGGALLSSAERRAAEANLDRVRADFSPQPPREPFTLPEPAAAAARVEGAEPATVLAATKPTGESVSYAIDRAAPDAPFTVARDERAPDGAVIPARTGTLDIAGEAHAGDVAHSAAGALTDSGKSVATFETKSEAIDFARAQERPVADLAPGGDIGGADLAAQPVGAAASEQRTMQLSPILPENVRARSARCLAARRRSTGSHGRLRIESVRAHLPVGLAAGQARDGRSRRDVAQVYSGGAGHHRRIKGIDSSRRPVEDRSDEIHPGRPARRWKRTFKYRGLKEGTRAAASGARRAAGPNHDKTQLRGL